MNVAKKTIAYHAKMLVTLQKSFIIYVPGVFSVSHGVDPDVAVLAGRQDVLVVGLEEVEVGIRTRGPKEIKLMSDVGLTNLPLRGLRVHISKQYLSRFVKTLTYSQCFNGRNLIKYEIQ